MIDNDLDFIDSSDNIIAGIDEAGRGPLAGPVVAACVVLSRNSIIPGINDSKKISEKKRNSLYKLILKESISIGIGMVHEREIDKINILQSTIIAMQHSLSDASVKPDIVLIDGTNISLGCDREKCIIKGDQKSLSIASASIIAKVTRDRIMNEYDKIYPKFLFSKHKGYGTIYHRRIIKDLKPVIIHRLSFAPMKGVYRKSHIYELIFNNKIKYISALLVKRGHLFVKIIGNKTNNGIVVSINNNNNIIFYTGIIIY